MTPDPTPAAAVPALSLEHWIYGSVPEVGYSVRAQSAELNLSFYARRLDGIYTPIAGENLHGEDTVVDVAMVHPTGSGNELLYSLIRPGPRDAEYQRRTFVNHTAVVPLAPLRAGTVGFEDIDRAIRAFDQTRGDAVGSLDPLPVTAGTGARAAPGIGLDRFVTRASAETLLSRVLQDPEARTLVLCRDSAPEVRRRTMVKLLELLALGCGLPVLPSLSDMPGLPVANRFQLVVSARAFRTDNSWALLDNALDAPSLPRVKDQDAAYASLTACFP